LRHIEINLPKGIDASAAERAIDAAIVAARLRVTLHTTLKKYTGCIHWHVKPADLPSTAGTLEITLWPQKKRAWIALQDGRRADWIEEKMKAIDSALRAALQQHPEG